MTRGPLDVTPDFEELRMIARWSDDDPEALAAAAAGTLVSFAADPAGLVVACRRLVAHNRGEAPVWWVAASVLSADDAAGAAGECARRLEQAPTLHTLVDILPFPAETAVGVVGATTALRLRLDQRPDLEVRELDDAAHGRRADDMAGVSPVLVEVVATDGSTALLPEAAGPLVGHEDPTTPVWAVVRVGRHVPAPLFRAMCAALALSRDTATEPALRPLDDFAAVVGPRGRGAAQRALGRPFCGAPPELLRPFA